MRGFESLPLGHRRQSGTQLLELAIVLPILALLVFIILEGGELVRVHTVLNNAAREGARFAVQPQNECPQCTTPYTAVMDSDHCAATNSLTGTDKFHDVIAAMCSYIKLEDSRPSAFKIATNRVTVTITESAIPNGLPNGQMRVYQIAVAYPYAPIYLPNFMALNTVLRSQTTFRQLGT